MTLENLSETTRAPTRNAHTPAIREQLICEDPSLAKQSFKEECDINTIMAKYQKTGLIDHINTYKGSYGDATGVQTYHEALNQIIAANDAFLSLPSKLRACFDNDPGTFLEYAENPENYENLLSELTKELTGAGPLSSLAEGPDPGSATEATVDTTDVATAATEAATAATLEPATPA